jgi:hypothetical protein
MKIPNFSLNFQKIILYQSINYCLDRVKEYHDYIYLKFQFWVLKLMNKNLSATGDFNPVAPISQEELKESIDTLSKEISKIEKSNIKRFLLKTAYELGTYYYLVNDYEKMKYNYDVCINYYDQCKSNQVYFEKDSLIKLLRLIEVEPYWMSNANVSNNDIEMKKISNENFFNTAAKENDFATLFQRISLNTHDKAIIEVNFH